MKKIGNIIWDELLGLPVSNPRAELMGYAQGLPRLRELDDGYVSVYCSRLPAARRLLRLWKGLKDERINAKITSGDGILRLDRRKSKAVFRFPQDVFRELAGFSATSGLSKKEEWSWFRGLWGAAGSIYSPQNGYHMVLRVKGGEDLGRRLLKVLRSVGIAPGTRIYRGCAEFMIRSQDSVVTCLVGMGLVRASLAVEETAMIRSVKSKANTVVNCDSANIKKSLSAARDQMALIREIEKKGLWNSVTPQMKELAMLRMENPSVSLRELGQMLSKRVSKSTVEYRWKRLESLIREL